MKARGLNESGEVVGLFTSADGTTISGFVIKGDTVTVIDDPRKNAVNGTNLEGVNRKRWIVGVWDDRAENLHGLILSPDLSTFYEITVPGSTSSPTFGINNSDRGVVASASGSYIHCDSRTHPAPKCQPAENSISAEATPIHVPPGTFAQYS